MVDEAPRVPDASAAEEMPKADSPVVPQGPKGPSRPKRKSKPTRRVKEEATRRTKREARPFPGRPLEDCARVIEAIKTQNAGNPWPPDEIAKAIKIKTRSSNLGEIIRSCNLYAVAAGTYRSPLINLTDLGKRLAYPVDDDELRRAREEAVLSVDLFRRVIGHYSNGDLPQSPFINNTLTREFGLPSEFHDEFITVLRKNIDYIGTRPRSVSGPSVRIESTKGESTSGSQGRSQAGRSRLRAFVIMPFTERPSESRPEGFHREVFTSIIKPACEMAGFEAVTADRRGSDIIHATILKEIVEADLVVADLTDHNPNVMFELGLRMAIGSKPVSIVKSRDTGRIFDVDNILRVYEYNGNLWQSTVDKDVPEYSEHIKATWESRDTGSTYVEILTGRSGAKGGEH